MAEDDVADRPDDPARPRRRPSADDGSEERPKEPGRLARLGRKLLDKGDDVKELASAVLESSDRAKTEMVRMVAREVRTYLDELKLKDDIRSLLTKNSLEIRMSFHLKPLEPEAAAEPRPKKEDGE